MYSLFDRTSRPLQDILSLSRPASEEMNTQFQSIDHHHHTSTWLGVSTVIVAMLEALCLRSVKITNV